MQTDDILWRYRKDCQFTIKGAGFSMWCFGTWQGKQYFIKQFLAPKYPANDTVSAPEKLESKIQACLEFEKKQTRLYQTLNRYSDGNDVRVREFFRVDSRYYAVTEKIDALPWTVATVAALPEGEKRRLCTIIAHAIGALHRGGLVHSDIKHDNILFTLTQGSVTAKVIDFDGGFLEDSPPSMEEGVTGDTNYFSPEVCARSYGENRPLTCKLDVFALGVLFHQYFSGELPGFDVNSSSCPGEAVLKGERLSLSRRLPHDLAQLISEMLSASPEARPDAKSVALRLHAKKSADDIVDQILLQTEAAKKRSEAEALIRYCSRCRKQISGEETICESCAAILRELSRRPPDSPFFAPGNL